MDSSLDGEGDGDGTDESPNGSAGPDSESFSMKLSISVIDPYEQQEGDLDPTPVKDANLVPVPTYITAQVKADGGKDEIGFQSDAHENHIVGSGTTSPYRESGIRKDVVSITPKEEESIVKRFKVILREVSSQVETGNTTGYPGNTTGYPGNTTGYPSLISNATASEARMQEAEKVLTALLTSLTSIEALAQCILLVNCLECTGKVENLNYTQCDVALSVAFSVEFHRSSYQLMRSIISRSKRTREPSVVSADSELKIRLHLLGAYQSLSHLNKGSVRAETNVEMKNVEALLMQESIALMCKQSSSKAEAMCWLQRSLIAKKTGIGSEVAETNQPSSGYVLPFSVYRALHGTIVEKNATPRPDSADDYIMTSEVCLASGLTYLFGVLTDPLSMKVMLINVDYLQVFQNLLMDPSSPRIQSLSISASIAAYVTQFLVSPLLGASGSADIFGLQSFCLALEISSLSTPQAFRSLLPCAVMHLQKCSKEEIVANILLKDISSSPLQR